LRKYILRCHAYSCQRTKSILPLVYSPARHIKAGELKPSDWDLDSAGLDHWDWTKSQGGRCRTGKKTDDIVECTARDGTVTDREKTEWKTTDVTLSDADGFCRQRGELKTVELGHGRVSQRCPIMVADIQAMGNELSCLPFYGYRGQHRRQFTCSRTAHLPQRKSPGPRFHFHSGVIE